MVNRREFLIASTTAVALCALPHVALSAPDYGNPDMEFRPYNVDGIPASGPYRPRKEDAMKWAERLGLPHPDEWFRPSIGWLIQKPKLRDACHKWMADNRFRCAMDDLV